MAHVLLQAFLGFGLRDPHARIYVRGRTVADCPDTGRILIGNEPQAFEPLDEREAIVGDFHFAAVPLPYLMATIFFSTSGAISTAEHTSSASQCKMSPSKFFPV